VTVGDEREAVTAPAIALVPADVPHEVRNAGDGPLRFLALYAGTDVVTRYETPVQPGGERERRPLG
jgi:mannose-6-phosphate isomerase-like protein (cupin superfamily)